MRTLKLAGLTLVFFGLALGGSGAQQVPTNAQDDLNRGVQLYKDGDFLHASLALQVVLKTRKDDIRAWHYLGLSLNELGRKDEAKKAHERAAKIAEALLDKSIKVPKSQLTEAAESADQFLALSPNLSARKTQEWRDRASYFRVLAADTAEMKIYGGKEVETKAKVLSKPNPSYTDEARRNQVVGTVVLRCVFTADGHVRAIQVVSGLPDGLNERAIQAAQHIKFIPATKDGKPVSMWMELQYNFNLF